MHLFLISLCRDLYILCHTLALFFVSVSPFREFHLSSILINSFADVTKHSLSMIHFEFLFSCSSLYAWVHIFPIHIRSFRNLSYCNLDATIQVLLFHSMFRFHWKMVTPAVGILLCFTVHNCIPDSLIYNYT